MTDINLKDLYQMFYEDPDFNGGLGGNPDDSKEDAAWDEAQSRFKQHKNNEKALKVGINQDKADEAKEDRKDRKSFVRRKLLGKQQNPFAIATAKAKEMGYSDFSEGSEGNTKRGEIAEAIKEQKMKKQYDDLEESYDKKPVRRSDPDSQRGDVGHDTRRKKDTDKSRRGIKKGADDYEELEEAWEKKPLHRGPWREAGSSTGRKKDAKSEKGRASFKIKKDDDYTRKLGTNFPNVDEFDVTNENAAVKHKEKKQMDTAEMVVNSVLKDLAGKGIIKSRGLEKAIPGLNKAEMSIPAIAGLIGAGAMLAKIFKLEDDGDDEHISKQVISYMEKNGDFFDGVGKMCEFICSLKDGEEPSDEGRGERLIEAASSFHKACAGAGGGGGGAAMSGQAYPL